MSAAPSSNSYVLSPGTPAPDFTLRVTPDQYLHLRDLQGRPVVIAFYPADWSPVCSDELSLFNTALPMITQRKAQMVGISVDSAWCHTAFAEARHLHFPLLADFQPKGDVTHRYGVYDETEGISLRALYVLDPKGVIAWSYLSPVGVAPGVDGILSALDQVNAATSSAHTAPPQQ